MKKLYIVCILLLCLVPSKKIFSQCMCSDGSTPDSIAYEQYFDSIIATNSTIAFPQFDPAIGALSCIKLSDIVTTVVNYNLQNNLTDTESYNFETYRRSQFTGPNGFLASVTSPPKQYGPFNLDPYDSTGVDPNDAISVGPDTTFNKKRFQKYVSPSAAYYGTGTVNFDYLTTSTFTILTGSDNAIIKLQAYTRLDVTLTYYWCPFSVLATRITNFNTMLEDKSVIVNWQLHNREGTDKCEIEMSKNGKDFTDLGEGISTSSGDVANYKYIYNVDDNFQGNLFFRVKRTDYSGRYTNSEIHSVAVSKNHTANYSLYPNPSITGVNIQFLKNTGGDYEVELINPYGQATYKKKYSLNASGSINIEWSRKPAPGMYYIKVKDLKDNTEQIERLQVM
jgi:hypothetical protein